MYCVSGSDFLATYFSRQITIINSKFCYFSLNLSSHPLFLQKMGSTGENRAPKFVRKPQLRQEDDGNRLIFECELSGHPQPEVTWFRQDEKISENDRTVIKSIGTQTGSYMVVLELEDVIESDAGLYKIKAKNTFGEVAASINLNFSRKSYEP